MKVINVTYNELKELRDSCSLIEGKFYRITDYKTTSVDPNTKVVNHKFDIIVKALDENHLFEKARICQREGETYFDDIRLESWKVWYCLDNNNEMYKWADPVNGTGVIYRMMDEFNNDCPYDFVNILFKKSKEWCDSNKAWCESVLGFEPLGDLYLYTFTWIGNDNVIEDLSIIGHKMTNEYGGITGVHDNYIEPCGDVMSKNIYKLGHNVFVSTEYWQPKNSFGGIYGNSLKSDCRYNTFGNDCNYNYLYSNCSHNTFGNYCKSNRLLTGCTDNIFRSSSYSNTLSNGCEKIILNGSAYNTFGPECSNIVAKVSMHNNTFGSHCMNINCGNPNNGYGRVIKFNIFENNVKNINFFASKSFSTGSIQNITVCQGVKGDDNYLDICIPIVNQDFQLKVGNNSIGELKIYCEADLVK